MLYTGYIMKFYPNTNQENFGPNHHHGSMLGDYTIH